MADRRNVLFVIIDQFRADCLEGALADHVDLPNLRGLMRDAVSFSNHFSVCAPCGPSRASILTGQYAMNHRAVRNGTPLPGDKPNLAAELRKGGYRPLLFGYNDIAQDPRRHDPNDPVLHTYEEVMHGFQEVVEMRLEESWPWRADLMAKGYDLPPYPDIFRPSGPAVDEPAIYSADDSDTAFLANALIRDLAARPPGWFAHITFIRPHPPLVAPAPYNRMYDPAALPAPVASGDVAAERARHPFLDACLGNRSIASNVQGFPNLEPTGDTIAKLRAIYLGLATEVDRHLGRILDFLKDSGQYDDTLLVVTSDHGEMLGDHHAWGKMTIYDAAYHVPLIIRDPSMMAQFGQTVSNPTESVDVTPTILDLLGLEIPDSMDGQSLAVFLNGETPAAWRTHTYSELDFGDPVSPAAVQSELGLTADESNVAILRTGDHTLVHFAGDLPQMLFDRNGEGELRDMAGRADTAAIQLDLSRRMLSHRMRNPEGLFANTMITEKGVQTGARTTGSNT